MVNPLGLVDPRPLAVWAHLAKQDVSATALRTDVHALREDTAHHIHRGETLHDIPRYASSIWKFVHEPAAHRHRPEHQVGFR